MTTRWDSNGSPSECTSSIDTGLPLPLPRLVFHSVVNDMKEGFKYAWYQLLSWMFENQIHVSQENIFQPFLNFLLTLITCERWELLLPCKVFSRKGIE